MDEQIRAMKNDRKKLEITHKCYKKIEVLPSNAQLEKKIVYLENNLQEKHQVIFNLDQQRNEEAFEALFQKVSVANKRLADLHAEAHQLDLEIKEEEEARERLKEFQERFDENERAKDKKILQCVYKNTKI